MHPLSLEVFPNQTMHCPALTELPAPPAGRTDWPWTEQTPATPDTQADGSSWPKISIVTPSYNQAQFLEATIRSILEQGYPNLEYMVIDGGSTDGSVEIIRSHESGLAYWVSEPDGGQYDAVNKGFERSTGEVMAWLNADDKYCPWALSVVGEIFATFPEVEWVTSGYSLNWDRHGRAVRCWERAGFNRNVFLRGANGPFQQLHTHGWIQQESTFWRRSLWERAGGGLDTSLRLAADFDLWARFFQHAELHTIGVPLGGFRKHGDQRSVHHAEQYVREARQVMERLGARPYGTFENKARHVLSYHSRALRPRRLMTRAGLIYPTKAVLWDGEGWRIRTRYIV
jgi:hypothetical protein